MRSPLRNLLTILTLALILAPEGVLLHRCACGRIFDCCCRMRARTGESCQLRHAGPHCSAGNRSEEAPSSLQNRQEPVDRFGTSLPWRLELRLALAGRAFQASQGALAGLFPRPPVPPPRFS